MARTKQTARAEEAPQKVSAEAPQKVTKPKQRKTLTSQYNLKLYIQTLLKEINPNVGISGEAKHLVNELIRSFIQRVVEVTNDLRRVDEKATLTHSHILTAINTVYPQEELQARLDDVLDTYLAKMQEMKDKSAGDEPTQRQPLGRRVGLTFSVSRVQNIANMYKTASKKSPKAFVALTVAAEELTRDLLSVANEQLTKHKTMNTRDIATAIASTPRFSTLFGRDVLGGGSQPDFSFTRDKGKVSIAKRPYSFEIVPSEDEQKVLDAVSQVAFRKLCFRAGMTRVEKECIPESKRIFFELLQPLVQSSVSVARGSSRKTVYWNDLRTSLHAHRLPEMMNTNSEKSTVGSSFTKCAQPPAPKKRESVEGGEGEKEAPVAKRTDRTRPLRYVKFYQTHSNSLFIPSATFKKLVQSIANDETLRLSRNFLVQLQLYVETMLVRVLSHAADISLVAKRETVSCECINTSYKNYRALVCV